MFINVSGWSVGADSFLGADFEGKALTSPEDLADVRLCNKESQLNGKH